jgi:hypothetical protein
MEMENFGVDRTNFEMDRLLRTQVVSLRSEVELLWRLVG